MFKFKPFNQKMKGEETTRSSGSGTSTWNPAQSEFYDQLLNQASGWLSGGGMSMGTDYRNDINSALSSAGQTYLDMATGSMDRTALNNALDANAAAATRQFERNVLPAIGTSSNLTGNASGSRRGIAEGLAASDLNAQIAESNSRLIYQAEQDAMQNRMAGAAGLQGLLGSYQNLSNYEAGQDNSYLNSLMAFRQLISGDMGGQESKVWNSTGSASGGGSWI